MDILVLLVMHIEVCRWYKNNMLESKFIILVLYNLEVSEVHEKSNYYFKSSNSADCLNFIT